MLNLKFQINWIRLHEFLCGLRMGLSLTFVAYVTSLPVASAKLLATTSNFHGQSPGRERSIRTQGH